MDVSVIIFPGTNREHDMADAIMRASGKKPAMIWHKEQDIGKPDLIVLPGGFSYGDYLRCGAMAAHSPIMKEVIRHAEKGTPIFGVCNGFQMLIETRLLPGALLHNKSLNFICKHVYLRNESSETRFTGKLKKHEVINVPVAHGEGNYFANDNILKELEDDDRIAFRYCDAEGQISEAANPNGSADNIAGIYNKRKTILGMMPHPENATRDWQAGTSGLKLFEGMLGR